MANNNKENNGKEAAEDKEVKEEKEKQAQAANDKDANKANYKKIKVKVIEKLINQINELKTTIDTKGEKGKAILHGIEDKVKAEVGKVSIADGKVNSDIWSGLTNKKQNEIHQSLEQLRDSLHWAAGFDGPTNRKHIMYEDYASNRVIILLALISFLLMILLLNEIVLRWDDATGMDLASKTQKAIAAIEKLEAAENEATKAKVNEADKKRALTIAQDEKNHQEAQRKLEAQSKEPSTQPDKIEKATEQVKRAKVEVEKATSDANHAKVEVEKATEQLKDDAVEAIYAIRKGGATEDSILLMVILTGALGGSLHLLRSFVEFVGNRQLKRSWVLYHLSLSLSGAGLAAIVYMLLRVGLMRPSQGSTDGSAISNLNPIGIYAFAALSGLFAKTALDKLNDVFKTLVGTKSGTADKESKDPLQS